MKGNVGTTPIVAERKAIYAAFITGLISFVICLIYFYGNTPPLFGRYSIGLAGALLAALVTFILFAIAWRMPKSEPSKKRSVRVLRNTGYWIKRSAVAFVHAALVFLLLSALFYLLQQAFKGLELNSPSAAAIVGLAVAAVSYMAYPLVYSLTLQNLSVILAAFLGVGVLTSAMSMQDPTWWQFHFSSLGAGNPVAAFAFNITLIVAGIVVVTITQLVMDDLKKLAKKRKIKTVKGIETARGLLMGTGIALACVGLFNFEDHLTIHNIAASGMAVLFIILVSGIPKFIPFLDRSFYTASYSMLAALTISIALFLTGFFNLTAFELVSAGIIFSWFIVFIRQVATFEPSQEVTY